MKDLWMALAIVGLLAAPSLAVVNVRVTSDTASLTVGETTTIRVQMKAPAGLGVSALAGSIVATGTGGLSASGFAFASAFNRTTPGDEFPSVLGAAGANGGWAAFGSGQNTQLMDSTAAAYGNSVWVTVASYTVTATTIGDMTLAFVPAKVGGFLPVSTDKDATLGTNTSVALGCVTTPPRCWGDVDGSGFVDGDDLAVFGYCWDPHTQQTDPFCTVCDLDGSGTVDGDDLAILAYGWLDCIPMY